mmetsp:Transcript_50564/g.126772  ORF Transcript_50564/g.126772 Transcript_50564/m.126772 type:complete len:245 (-) Transcript_50564:1171-1905(-)
MHRQRMHMIQLAHSRLCVVVRLAAQQQQQGPRILVSAFHHQLAEHGYGCLCGRCVRLAALLLDLVTTQISRLLVCPGQRVGGERHHLPEVVELDGVEVDGLVKLIHVTQPLAYQTCQVCDDPVLCEYLDSLGPHGMQILQVVLVALVKTLVVQRFHGGVALDGIGGDHRTARVAWRGLRDGLHVGRVVNNVLKGCRPYVAVGTPEPSRLVPRHHTPIASADEPPSQQLLTTHVSGFDEVVVADV